MPRTVIDHEYSRIERISVLDGRGNLDSDLDPGLTAEEGRACYRAMLRARRLDERMLKLQRQGRMGTFAPCHGQEAAQIGTVFPLQSGDWLVPSYREPGAMLWVGWPMDQYLQYWNGSWEGGRVPEGVTGLPVAVPVGSQPLHAVGLAYGMKYRRRENLALVYFGDGASSEGDALEAMNFAGVWQAPVVFVCQNNQYAISTPRAMQTNAQTIAQKAVAFGFPGVQVDGNDILAVIVAAREAADRARRGEGPTLIEAETYRLSLHTTADDPTKYRSQEEVQEWEKRDPLLRFGKYLKAKHALTDEQTAKWTEEIDAEIKAAIKSMNEKIGQANVLEAFDHVYADPAIEILEQRRECEAALSAER
jgi:pyruvate dehydrogenase E1 component alpha subunit